MAYMAVVGILLLFQGNVAIIFMRGCTNDGYINIEEDRQDPVVCEGLYYNQTVTWYISGDKWPDRLLLGICGPLKTGLTTCNSSYDNIMITRSATQSRLTILQNHRDFSQAYMICGELEMNYACRTRVVRSAKPTACNIFIRAQGNTERVYGSCYMDKTFASDKKYECQWQYSYPNYERIPMTLASLFITAPYMEAGRLYDKATCAFSTPVFNMYGTYRFYFSFSPGPYQQQVGTLDIPYTVQQQEVIAKPLTLSATGANQLILTCNSWMKIGPPTWTGVMCTEGNQGHTCTFTPDPSSDEGNIVTCTAYFLEEYIAGSTVHASFILNLNPPSAPVITGYQPGQVLFLGDTLLITCSVSGGDPLVTSVTFYCGHMDDDTNDIRNDTQVSSQVIIDPLRAEHNGMQCACVASWPKDQQLDLSTKVILIVEAPVAATVDSLTVNGKTGSMAVNSGDRTPLILSCATSGRPKPSIRVVRVDTGQPLEVDTSHTSGHDENVQQYTLTTSARCQDAAIYRCEASNTAGKDQQDFSLFVSCAPLQGDKGTVQNPLHLFVMDGTQSMTFNIVAFPTPLVSIVFLGSSLLVDDNSEQGKTSDVLNARCVPTATVFQSACTVTADKPESEDEGFYNVTVRNNFGEASYIVQLSLAQSAVARDSKSAFPAAAVGGGVAAAVVVAALVVVGVIVYRKYFGDTYDRPMPRQQEDNYTDLVLYEDVGNKQVQTGTGVYRSHIRKRRCDLREMNKRTQQTMASSTGFNFCPEKSSQKWLISLMLML